ncbi:phage holin family protein [Rhodocaloribacter litoris]|uniref:phage holin family protein n=1 Tax=Rhodocaloribacter litoris TaxID=2558931 RepID=UPI0014225F13|nr:phage holin family protein [Rhodocaloribacter litoris]QXD16092.1 phage holin family protein [Rhodocaloribacter litoris]
MDTPEQHPSLTGGAGPERQLPSDATRLERIALHTRGLVEDVKEWVDLKIQLVQVQIEERIEERLNRAALGVVLGVVVLLALVFALTAAALGLGAWLGHSAWGFLVVAGVLLVVAGLLRAVRPRLVKVREAGSEPPVSSPASDAPSRPSPPEADARTRLQP